MDQIFRTFQLFGLIFLVLTLLYNIIPGMIRIPGEPRISKFGFSLYIPLFTSLIASVVLTILLNYLKTI
jgi:hypothetical protein